MKILFVNAAVREESRTYTLARRLLDQVPGEIREECLNDEKLLPLDRTLLEKRMKLQAEGNFDDPLFDQAKALAWADRIVIAAPYWDLSFPSLLKVWIERVCALGITFAYNEKDEPYSLCRADRVVYITTAGGPIYSDEPGFGYVKMMMQTFFGVGRVDQIKAEGLDIRGADVDAIMDSACRKIDEYILYEW